MADGTYADLKRWIDKIEARWQEEVAALAVAAQLGQLVGHLGGRLIAVGHLHVHVGLLHGVGPGRAVGQARGMAHQVLHRHRAGLRL